MAGHPKLLLADDDVHKRSLLAHYLAQEFGDPTIVECDSGAAAIEHLHRAHFDAVVSNHSMYPVDGVELVRWIRAHRDDLPVIMVTGSPKIASEAHEAGVDRVLDTSAYQSIGPVVRRFIEQRPRR